MGKWFWSWDEMKRLYFFSLRDWRGVVGLICLFFLFLIAPYSDRIYQDIIWWFACMVGGYIFLLGQVYRYNEYVKDK